MTFLNQSLCLYFSVSLADLLTHFFPTSETLVGTLYGTYYTGRSVIWAVARGLGYQWADATDPNHKAVQFLAPPAKWTVNPASHWRHHFDNPRAYFCGTYTFLDKLLGTAVSLQGKTIAVTGASGALGQALSRNLIDSGARVIALTSSRTQPIILEVKGKPLALETVFWQIGHEQDLAEVLARTDILILNHGMNVHHQRTEQAVQQSFEVNTWSSYRLLELFLSTVRANRAIAEKEVWAVTSEAEVAPAQSPLYELSKRTFGELVTLKRLDAPCVIRKILLGGFRSKMSPKAPMSANWVAKQILDLVKRDTRNVIISYRLWIYVVYPIREFLLSSYFKAHSRKSVEDIATIDMIPMHEEA